MVAKHKIITALCCVLFAGVVGCSSGSEKEQSNAAKPEPQSEIDKLAASVKLQVVNTSPEMVKSVVEALDEIEDEIEKSSITDNKKLEIHLKSHSSTGSMTIDHTANKAKEVIDKLKEEKVTALETIKVFQAIPLVDAYNNKEIRETYSIEYNYPEVMKLKADGSTIAYHYFRFAQFQPINEFGEDDFREWCAQDAFRNISEPFCDR